MLILNKLELVPKVVRSADVSPRKPNLSFWM
jgi:hypothetical protein